MAALARELNVSKSTITRDFQTFRSWYGQRLDPFFSARRRLNLAAVPPSGG
jgi:hypothetical protein